jgi:addiction module RelE/StbE family toxin
MIVEWSDLALDDLEDIKNYISKDSPYYARELVESVFIAAERLIDFPFSGRQVPEAEDSQIREIIVQSYRTMYRVESHRVLILAVMHGSRDFSNPKNQIWDI